MYLYCELYVVTGRPIREVPFDYEFAAFAPEERTEARQAIAMLREFLGDVADAAIALPGDGMDALRRLGSTELTPVTFDRALTRLGAEDVKRLQRYVEARMRLARRVPRKTVTRVRSAGDAIWRQLRSLFEED
jgi:hypothetical protein